MAESRNSTPSKKRSTFARLVGIGAALGGVYYGYQASQKQADHTDINSQGGTSVFYPAGTGEHSLPVESPSSEETILTQEKFDDPNKLKLTSLFRTVISDPNGLIVIYFGKPEQTNYTSLNYSGPTIAPYNVGYYGFGHAETGSILDEIPSGISLPETNLDNLVITMLKQGSKSYYFLQLTNGESPKSRCTVDQACTLEQAEADFLQQAGHPTLYIETVTTNK